MINNLFLLKKIIEKTSDIREIPQEGLEFLQGYISYVRSGVKDLMWIIITLLIVIILFLGFLIYKSTYNGNNNNK
ncbi:hypothetical protein K9L05_04230 [Candidatus Babeliales bacterium]|nr:hypothetical protein [Candidatus Babeliales bacterium]MCF7899820.1 hypothetical protein [Candidatus Babeliales bacterium]